MGYIYKIKNIINGMTYVGQTINSLEKRWKYHILPSSNCRYLKSAFKKYGIHNFEFKLICICFDSDLNYFETKYIQTLNTIVPNGYNLREGGSNGRHNEETKKKISKTLTGRTDIIHAKTQLGIPLSEETKKKISESLKGRPKPRPKTGKPLPEETKHKISIACKEAYKTKGVHVSQYDLNNNFIQHFISITEASKQTNADRSHIRKCCNGARHTANGFKWRYLESNDCV